VQKVIGYIRVSTQGQADKGASLEAQRAKIEAWCNLNDGELVAVFEDAGISGSGMTKRDGLQDALKATDKGMALVTYSISRLARNTLDMLNIAQLLEKKGADLVSLSERIDTTTASGRMVFRMLAVLAEFELDQAKERTCMVVAHKKANGEAYCGAPFGFEAIEGRLVQVQAEAAIVAEIQAARASGNTLQSIADTLNGRGIPTKTGKTWQPATIHLLMKRTALVPAH
jgi:site-specific DNA recombinase